MRSLSHSLSGSILLILSAVDLLRNETVAQKKPPRFEDFPVKTVFKGNPAPAKLSSRKARMFRTVLREGAKEGPNFAGHYTIVEWGCGTNCSQFAVIHTKTGRIHFPPFGLYNGLLEMPESLRSEKLGYYRVDSSLLVVYGLARFNNKGIHFFNWNGQRFKLIRSIF